jgi:hypothetical protein
MNISPNAPLYRIHAPLNWSGDLLRAQPRAGITRGVSFFAPSHDIYLGKCDFISPSVTLPPNLRLVNDIHLKLPLEGNELDDLPTINCGEHWLLYTTIDMPVEEFEAAYSEVVKVAFFGFSDLERTDVDTDLMPGDRRSYVAVMALDELVADTKDENVRLFAKLFSLHIRATDMDFDDLLNCGPIANMVATALDGWTVRDPFIEDPAHEAQHRLADALESHPKKIRYIPLSLNDFHFT